MKVVFKRCYDISKVVLMTKPVLRESQNKIINTDHSLETTGLQNMKIKKFQTPGYRKRHRREIFVYSCIIFLWQEKGSKGYQVIYLVSLSMRNTKRKEVYLNYVNGVSKGRELQTLVLHIICFKRKQPTNTKPQQFCI